MKKTANILGIGCLIIFLISTNAVSADKAEHREFSRVALDSVLNGCKAEFHDLLDKLFMQESSLNSGVPLWQGKSFAEISKYFSGTDLSATRSHKRGQTVLQQLRQLSPNLINETWIKIAASHQVRSFEQNGKNVLVNYLLHHLLAMKFAGRAGRTNSASIEDLRFAFIYEAMAMSYLVDAFSSAHILINYKFLSGLQRLNYRRAHSFFSSKGVFVINSQGDAWQAFGDRLMLWFAPTYRQTLRACQTSIKELLLVFYSKSNRGATPQCLLSLEESLPPGFPVQTWLENRTGTDYYENLRMPSLLLLPMPVSATWSKRDHQVDLHGIHKRINYPQLREPGLHDPDLDGIDKNYLPSRADIPGMLIFNEFRGKIHPDSAKKIIRYNKKFASVRYTQPRSLKPAYFGILLSAAGGKFFQGSSKYAYSFGAGFGLLDDLLLLNNLSLDVEYSTLNEITRQHFLTTTLGVGINLKLPSVFALFKALRFEVGHAWETGRKFNFFHNKIAVGIELPSLPLGFTYAGLTSRIMLQRIATISEISGVYFQVVLH